MAQPVQPSGPSVRLVMTPVTSPHIPVTLPPVSFCSSPLTWEGFLVLALVVYQCWRCQLCMHFGMGLDLPVMLLPALPWGHFCSCLAGIWMRERVSPLGTRTVSQESCSIHLEFLITMTSLPNDLLFTLWSVFFYLSILSMIKQIWQMSWSTDEFWKEKMRSSRGLWRQM